MKVEKIVLNEERNVTLTVYAQEVGGEYRYVTKRPFLLVLPGGGYQFCSDREADPIAFPYLKAGYQVGILRYSVREHATWPQPLKDYEQAMEVIKEHAGEWNLYEDKIAVIGFSAGGHLAASAATMSENRPAAAILGYAVVGEDVKGCNPTAPDTIPFVDKDTCPCFLFSYRTDNVVPVMNTVRFMEALTLADVAFESHIYSYGPHGYSTGDISIQEKSTHMSPRGRDWVEDSIEWLGEVLGEFAEGGLGRPVCDHHVTKDHEAFLSVDCTIRRLMGNPEASRVILDLLGKMAEARGMSGQGMDFSAAPKTMKLRDALNYGGVGAEGIEALNQVLSAIPNI